MRRNFKLAAAMVFLSMAIPVGAAFGAAGDRLQVLLSDATWQYAGSGKAMPAIGTPEFNSLQWADVRVPHVFQTREAMDTIEQAWYRRQISITPEMEGKQIYIVLEGAAAISDVYVNGKHLGQHRGAYTRYVVDATAAVHAGDDNTLAVNVDNDPADTADCLPSKSRLYKVWGGIYRKVWLVAVDPLHVDPTDYSSPGVYITPTNVTDASADLAIQVLLRNSSAAAADATVLASLIDPAGTSVQTFNGSAHVDANGKASVDLNGRVSRPELWAPGTPNLYHVRVDVVKNGAVVDSVTEPTGFRDVVWADGKVKINGKPIVLIGGDIHQEIEQKASAMSDDDIRAGFAAIQDLGFNFVRLPHYPHQKLEYDLCDHMGICCWAENGHSNQEAHTPNADYITTEMVKQNYNHPAIVLWSVGNEASAPTAEALVPVVKALDKTRPVFVANMKCANADFHAANTYPGWYSGNLWTLAAKGYISEVGAGGVVTIHTDYAAAKKTVDKYEPEEYQQMVAEADFEQAFRNNDALGMFAWWTIRDFNDVKYKKPVGWNTKGLMTYAGFKKDVYYLYRSFQRHDLTTVHITSKLYFIREGDPNNGIKVYSNAARLTLSINGAAISTLDNGKYLQGGVHPVDNVFYWPTPLHLGKNVVEATDGAGHSDSATIYFYGQGGLPEAPLVDPLVTNVQSSNPKNPAYYMDMPVEAQWPIYYDLDSTADNSFEDVPDAVRGATWIAARRLTKAGQEAAISFTVARPATVYLMATITRAKPASINEAGFSVVKTDHLVWRDNSLMVVPAELFSMQATAGQQIKIPQDDRDMVVMVKAAN